jgi:NADH-quinone oxidoreductase subunit C
MSGEKDLEQIKKEAAEKAKELAKQRLAAKQSGGGTEPAPAAPMGNDADLAKKKAAAAAKAKAAAMAKMKATGQAEEATSAPSAPEAPAGSDDDDLAKKKAAAVAKAKAAAAAKLKAKAQAEGTEEAPASADDDDLAKKKAAAVAKAKAAAAAKLKAKAQAEGTEEAPASADDDDLAKKKAAAVAKAKAAAAAKAKAAAMGGDAGGGSADDEKAKAIAAAKAKAAAAMKAKAAAGAKAGAEVPAEEKKPSPNQPYLDKYVKVITDNLGADILEDSYINPLSKDVPTLVAKKESYHRLAAFLKYNELLGFDYLSELHGTDFVTHMEVYVHLYSYKNRQSVALKVKLDRDEPVIESVTPLWAGANWPECETYDLLGIKFEGHPNLHRIMLGEDWVGHPLRKDYEPYDVEV